MNDHYCLPQWQQRKQCPQIGLSLLQSMARDGMSAMQMKSVSESESDALSDAHCRCWFNNGVGSSPRLEVWRTGFALQPIHFVFSINKKKENTPVYDL